jgi:hypothetical protein
MSEINVPLYTGTVNGHPVRFFKAPLPGLHIPWHAVEDLQKAANLPRDLRRRMLRMTQESWPGQLRTVATADGLVTIAPHYAAQGFIGAAIKKGYVPASLEIEYANAGAKAMQALGAGLPPAARFELAIRAARNSLDEGAGQ